MADLRRKWSTIPKATPAFRNQPSRFTAWRLFVSRALTLTTSLKSPACSRLSITLPLHRKRGSRHDATGSRIWRSRRDQANADTRHQFGGKIAAGHCGCFFMNSERQERNSLCGSSAAAIESDTSSTIAHCPCDLRITALFGSTLFVLSFSEVGTAETQAQSPLLRILTSVKTTFACHPCESSCIGLLARNPSRIARRKGDPAGGVSMGSSPKALAAMMNGRIRQSFFITLHYLKLVVLVTRP